MSQAGNSNLSTARVLGMEGNDCSLIFLPFLSRTHSFKLCHLASGKTKKKKRRLHAEPDSGGVWGVREVLSSWCAPSQQDKWWQCLLVNNATLMVFHYNNTTAHMQMAQFVPPLWNWIMLCTCDNETQRSARKKEYFPAEFSPPARGHIRRAVQVLQGWVRDLFWSVTVCHFFSFLN